MPALKGNTTFTHSIHSPGDHVQHAYSHRVSFKKKEPTVQGNLALLVLLNIQMFTALMYL